MPRKSRALPPSPFRRFNSSSEVIRLVVLMYVRFPLSLRNVEDLLSERGIDICHETVRFWWNRFGPMFAADIRRQRVSRMRGFRHWRWHLDEVYVKINGETAQPSKTVVPGDRVQVTGAPGRTRILEVVETVSKRVGAPVAATCYIDRSPPPPPAEMLASQPRRARGAGRPTKRERRELDRLHGRR